MSESHLFEEMMKIGWFDLGSLSIYVAGTIDNFRKKTDDRLCRNKLDFDPHSGCFGDFFQGLECEALILAALDPRNRLLAGSHKPCQFLLRQAFLIAKFRFTAV